MTLTNTPIILHIETATEACSVAISRGEEVLAFCEATEAMAHTTQTTILIEQCLKQANLKAKDLDAVSVSKGPGSYTALRVGSSIAKGMCYALNIPLIAVDSLQSLAMAAAAEIKDNNALYCGMIDARRMEVYAAIYDVNGVEKQALQCIIIDENSFSTFIEKNQQIVLCGNGAEKCRSLLSSEYISFLPSTSSAIFLIKIANQHFINRKFQDISVYSPEYAKNPNITTAKKIF